LVDNRRAPYPRHAGLRPEGETSMMHSRRVVAAKRTAALLLAAAALAGCQRSGPATPAGGEVTAMAQQAHAAVAAADLSDPASFADAKRGFIAAPKGQVKDEAGNLIWDYDAFAFVQGKSPATVNPSLWRQALLNNQIGLFKVRDGIWQLRGFDLANITLIEGQTGWIVVDTLTSRETAAAAMAFARQHLGNKPVSAVILTHSHVDHFGGALGVIPADEAKARGVPVVAPVGFMEEATGENLMMGVAMGRRSMYMYGSRLPRDAGGLVDTGLGKAVACGRVGILAPTVVVDQPMQELVIDGLRFVFHNVPGSEAAGRVHLLPAGAAGLLRRRTDEPHAAQHLHAARRQGARRAEVGRLPGRVAGACRAGRGAVQPAPLAGVGPRAHRRVHHHAARCLPPHPRPDGAADERRPHRP
jgi:alkyl sulfatase BDS1-like metallo-beta-lactamase superfamily hydrolase